MTFTVYKASDFRFEATVTVSTLKELKAIAERTIVDFDDMTITIYDDYVE